MNPIETTAAEITAEPIDQAAEVSAAETQVVLTEVASQETVVVAEPVKLVISPTVGRKVHFYPNGFQPHSNPYAINIDDPMDADVVFVWGDRMVNVTVRDHIGQVHAFTSVTLRQPDDDSPEHGNPYVEWMPYQAEQARQVG